MAEEQIICCGDPYRGNNDALMGALLGRQDNGAEMAALMNGGANNWMNNPFAYMMMMGMMRMMYGEGWNQGGNLQNAEIQGQLNAIRTQMSDNQNSNLLMDGIHGNTGAIRSLSDNLNCDFNMLNQSICAVRSAIQEVSGQVGFSAERVINAVNMGDCNVIQALQNCCCQTQQAILKMGYEQQLATCQQTGELRNGQRDLGVAIAQGFSATAFQAQQDKCDIIRAGQDNTQRIIDTLNNHWSAEDKLKIQDLKFELSQERQNRYIASVMNGGCGCASGNMCGGV